MLRSGLKNIVDAGVGPHLSLVDAKHVRITNIIAVIGWMASVSWIPLLIGTELAWTIAVFLTGAVLLGVGVESNRRHNHLAAAFIVFATGTIQSSLSVWLFGADRGTIWFLPQFIVMPFLIFPTRARVPATLMSLLVLAEYVFLAANQDLFPAPVDIPIAPETQMAGNALITGAAFIAMALGFQSTVDDTEAALEAEHARSESLLLNVLPPLVARRLQETPDEPIADRFEEVSVLFADIVGFTPLSARVSAERTVDLLNEIFGKFDALCDVHGVEKIKTIGDGYMAVAGAPVPCADHALRLVAVAVAMRDWMATDPTGEGLQLRIGINSGDAVGAIVGTSRFHYDLWSDTVNTAARMESHGAAGRIQIGRPTWERVHTEFACEARGTIDVKGKGPMETWFVT